MAVPKAEIVPPARLVIPPDPTTAAPVPVLEIVPALSRDRELVRVIVFPAAAVIRPPAEFVTAPYVPAMAEPVPRFAIVPELVISFQ
jgi:hypothetical protein